MQNFGVSMLDGFHECKAGHTIVCHYGCLKTIKARMLSCGVCNDNKNKEWHFNWEFVNQFRGLALGRVCKGATWAGIAHLFDVGEHLRPIAA
jgi:hypothetical protein